MEPVTIERAYIVAGGDIKHRVTIPASDIKVVDGVTYLHLSTVPTYMANLLAVRNGGERSLSHTDIIETICQLRNDKLGDVLAQAHPADGLCVFNPKWQRTNTDKAKYELPETIEIGLPPHGDIPGRCMQVLLGHKRSGPLYVRFPSSSMRLSAANWVRQASTFTKKLGDTQGDDQSDGSPPTFDTDVDEHEPKLDEHVSMVEHDGVENHWSQATTVEYDGDDRLQCSHGAAPARTHKISSYFMKK
jgi:hypothetical protein